MRTWLRPPDVVQLDDGCLIRGKGPTSGNTDWDAAVLSASKNRLTCREIAGELVDGGYPFQTSKPQMSVATCLKALLSKGNLVRTKDGRHNLWSPPLPRPEPEAQSEGADTILRTLTAEGVAVVEIREQANLTFSHIMAGLRQLERAGKAVSSPGPGGAALWSLVESKR